MLAVFQDRHGIFNNLSRRGQGVKNLDEIRSSIIHNIIQDFQTLISSASVTQIKRCCAKKNEGTGLVPIQSRFCQLED